MRRPNEQPALLSWLWFTCQSSTPAMQTPTSNFRDQIVKRYPLALPRLQFETFPSWVIPHRRVCAQGCSSARLNSLTNPVGFPSPAAESSPAEISVGVVIEFKIFEGCVISREEQGVEEKRDSTIRYDTRSAKWGLRSFERCGITACAIGGCGRGFFWTQQFQVIRMYFGFGCGELYNIVGIFLPLFSPCCAAGWRL